MKRKQAIAAALLLSAFGATSAQADEYCSLSVSSWYVPVGASFSFDVNIGAKILPGPLPPNGIGYYAPLTVVFHGTKNGVWDTGPNGWQHPSTVGFGTSTLTGYGNPASGGFGGQYDRYAFVYDRFGNFYCSTNSVSTILQ
jgi:hypothetical protein